MKKIIMTLALLFTIAIAGNAQVPADIQTQIDQINANLPMQVSDDMKIQKLDFDNNNLVMVYVVSATMYPQLEPLKDVLSQAMKAEFTSSTDDETRALINIMRTHNVNLVQRFTSTDGRSFDLVITPADL